MVRNMNKRTRLHMLGYKVGLSKSDINCILKENSYKKEELFFSRGPGYHDGTYYGTISIYEFKN